MVCRICHSFGRAFMRSEAHVVCQPWDRNSSARSSHTDRLPPVEDRKFPIRSTPSCAPFPAVLAEGSGIVIDLSNVTRETRSILRSYLEASPSPCRLL